MPQQYCTFLLCGHLFAIPVATVEEVLKRQEMTDVPLAAREVSGLLNLRGQIVTTIDLRARLGLPPRAHDGDAVNVVVRTPDGVVSLLVDEIGDVLEPVDDSFEPAPDTVADNVRELVTTVAKLPDRLMLVLDTERAVSGDGAA